MVKSGSQATKYLFMFSIILMPVVDGSNQCTCQCYPSNYVTKGVCAFISDMLPKIDTNEDAILQLRNDKNNIQKKFYHLQIKVDKMEKLLNEKIKPQQPGNKEYSSESSEYSQYESVQTTQRKTEEAISNLTAEIRYLKRRSSRDKDELLKEIRDQKKWFQEEKGGLSEKIKKLEANILGVQNYTALKINGIETRLLKVKDELHLKIDETENRSLKMDRELSTKIKELREQSLGVKDELTAKLDETVNQFSKIKHELFTKVESAESMFLKTKHELLTKIEEVENQSLGAQGEILVKMQEVEKWSIKVKDQLLEESSKAKNRSLEMQNAFLEKINETEHEFKQQLESERKERQDLEEYSRYASEKILHKTEEAVFNLTAEIRDQKTRCLKDKNELLKKIEDEKSVFTKAKDELSGEIKELEDRTLGVQDDLTLKINEMKTQLLKVKDELYVKINETEILSLQMDSELLTSIKKLEEQSLGMKNELIVKVDEAVNQFSEAKHELFAKTETVKNLSLNTKRELMTKIEEVENQLLRVQGELLMKLQKAEEWSMEMKAQLLEESSKAKNRSLEMQNTFLAKINKTGYEFKEQMESERKARQDLQEYSRNASEQVLHKTEEAVFNLTAEIHDQKTRCLKVKNELLEKIKDEKSLFTKAKGELSEEIKELEAHTLGVQDDLTLKLNEIKIQLLTVKDELYMKINETEVLSKQMDSELLTSIKELEEQSLGVTNELTVKVDEAISEFSEAKQEFFSKTERIKNLSLNTKHELMTKIEEVENQSLGVQDELLMKMRKTEKWSMEVEAQLTEESSKAESRSLEMQNDFLAKINETEHEFKQQIGSERKSRQQLEEKLNETQKTINSILIQQAEVTNALQENITSSFENLKEYNEKDFQFIYSSIYELKNENFRKLEDELRKVETKVANCTMCNDVANPDKGIQNIDYPSDGGVIDEYDFQQNLMSDLEELKGRVDELENGEALMNMALESHYSNISQIWSHIKRIETSGKYMITESCGIIQDTGNQFKGNNLLENEIESISIEGQLETVTALSKENKFLLIVQKKATWQRQYENICTAVLIRDQWAITAAHCVDNKFTSYRIKAGIDGGTKNMSPVKVEPILPEEYDSSSYTFDIALLKIAKQRDTSFLNHFILACLPKPGAIDKISGSAVFLTGDIQQKKSKDFVLQLHEVYIIMDDDCKELYPSIFDNTMVCTTYDLYVKQLCQDSGGGLLLKVIKGKVTLIGIVTNCGEGEKPIIYTKIAHFANWIDSAIEFYHKKLVF